VLEHGAHSQITKLGSRTFEEDVCGLDVPMDYFVLMQALEGFAYL